MLAIQILNESLFPFIKILAIAPWYLDILLLFIFIKVVLFFLKIKKKIYSNYDTSGIGTLLALFRL